MANGIKQDHVLIADDNATQRALLKHVFQDKYKVLEATNGKEVLQMLMQDYQSVAVILLDILMPVMDGLSVLRILKEKKILNRIPVVLITAEESKGIEEEGYALGASDIVRKPFDTQLIAKRMDNLIELYVYKNRLEAMVRQQTRRLEMMNDRMLEVMCTIVESKDEESPSHIDNVKKYTRLLAEKLRDRYPEYGLDDKRIELVVKGCVLHDIGKMQIEDTVLKKTTTLTEDELKVVQSHTTKGSEMIQMVAGIQDGEYYRVCYDICRYHHERYDGKGYPEGLKGEEIPLSAQIVGLVDSYDKLTSDNVRRRAYGNKEAMQMIMEGECGEFSPKLLECFGELKDQL